MDLNEIRKAAGLPLVESLPSDASSEHVEKESALFADACAALTKIEAMATERLKAKDLSPQHKSQYEKLLKDAKDTCAVMKAHLDTYK